MRDAIIILFNFLGTLLNYILGFAFFYLLRIFFPIEVIGVFYLIQSKLMIINFISDLGLSITLVKFFPESLKTQPDAHKSTFLIIKIAQFVIYTIWILIQYASEIFMSSLSIAYVLCLIFIFSENIFNFLTSPYMLCNKEVIKQKFLFNLNFLLKIIMIFIITALLPRTIQTLMGIFLSGSLVSSILSIFLIPKFKLVKFDFQICRMYLKYSIPFMISSIIRVLYDNYLVLIINRYGNEYEIANFGTAFQIYTYVSQIPIIISQILIVTFAFNHMHQKQDENRKLISQSHKYLTLILSIIFILTAFFSEIFFVFIFGIDYALTSRILIFLIAERLLLGYFYFYYVDLQVSNRNYTSEVYVIIRFVVFLILSEIFMGKYYPQWGIDTLLLINLISSLFYSIIFSLITCRKFHYSFYWGWFIQITVVFVVIAQFWIVKSYSPFFNQNSILLALILLVEYILLLWLSRTITIKEIKTIFKVFAIENLVKEIKSQMGHNDQEGM